FDIPVTDFTESGMILSDIFQFKFDGQSGVSPSTIFVDNIYFYKAESEVGTDATLSAILVNDVAISGFDAAITAYEVELPFGTIEIATLAGTATDDNASVSVTQATELEGSASVLVTAEDGTSTTTYTVNYSVATEASVDATLSDIMVGDVSIGGIDAATLSYSVALPFGTTEIPVVSAISTNLAATMVITQATEVAGSATIVVTAGDETTTLTYTVSFSNVIPSTDATLSNLNIDGEIIADFGASTLAYSVVLPTGTTEVPVVSVTAMDANASVVITQAESVTGLATVIVTAEDGVSVSTYTITFSVGVVTAIGVDLADSYHVYAKDGMLNVKISVEGSRAFRLEVYTLTGRVLVSEKLSNNSIEMPINAEGLIVVRISDLDNNTTWMTKILVK
ncbi:MAG: hypothetical protein OCD76_04500, partial [Reichenbachiella sp.]